MPFLNDPYLHKYVDDQFVGRCSFEGQVVDHVDDARVLFRTRVMQELFASFRSSRMQFRFVDLRSVDGKSPRQRAFRDLDKLNTRKLVSPSTRVDDLPCTSTTHNRPCGPSLGEDERAGTRIGKCLASRDPVWAGALGNSERAQGKLQVQPERTYLVDIFASQAEVEHEHSAVAAVVFRAHSEVTWLKQRHKTPTFLRRTCLYIP